jgi:hypothetical protein
MRFACGDMRDHIVSYQNGHRPSYWRRRALRQQARLRIDFSEILRVVRFSTFATISATSGLMHRSKQLYSITSSVRESSIGGMVRARRSLHIARNSAGVSIIGTAMKTKFHRARGKLGLFAARRLSLHHCHRMLTASIVASSSLIVPLAVFKPAWPEEIE